MRYQCVKQTTSFVFVGFGLGYELGHNYSVILTICIIIRIVVFYIHILQFLSLN